MVVSFSFKNLLSVDFLVRSSLKVLTLAGIQFNPFVETGIRFTSQILNIAMPITRIYNFSFNFNDLISNIPFLYDERKSSFDISGDIYFVKYFEIFG